ncbi:hypothetical protein HWD35_21480 [Tsukamurella tyrosinosolvens]|uniref:hypothetical protein n=1 Tax=Tsukamurella tyrosinosolvens TaxID=57704 RepID=UPI001CE060F7|nr:hypothetical protein [Tsukamurella tyrosinosolvens]MCA4997299.1 hypothetical protein [Tsukamurella tyrosinosolvens]
MRIVVVVVVVGTGTVVVVVVLLGSDEGDVVVVVVALLVGVVVVVLIEEVEGLTSTSEAGFSGGVSGAVRPLPRTPSAAIGAAIFQLRNRQIRTAPMRARAAPNSSPKSARPLPIPPMSMRTAKAISIQPMIFAAEPDRDGCGVGWAMVSPMGG